MRFVLMMAVMLSALSCGNAPNDEYDPRNKPETIVNSGISGTVTPHAIHASLGDASGAEFKLFQLSMVDGFELAMNGNYKYLASPISLANCNNNSCNYDLPAVNVGGSTQGFLSFVEDKHAEGQWLKTLTGVLHGTELLDQQKNPSHIVKKLYTVHRSVEKNIATLLGVAPGTFEQKGFILGRLLDKEGNPVEGAAIFPQTDTSLTYYVHGNKLALAEKPMPDYFPVITTDASGLFVIVPAASQGFIPADSFIAGFPGDKYTWDNFQFQSFKGYAQVYEVHAK